MEVDRTCPRCEAFNPPVFHLVDGTESLEFCLHCVRLWLVENIGVLSKEGS